MEKNELKILDDWIASGSSLVDLRNQIEENERMTKFFRFQSNALQVLSYKYLNKDNITVFDFNPMEKLPSEFCSVPVSEWESIIGIDALMKKGDFSALLDELRTKNKMMLYDDVRNILFFTSEHVCSDLILFGMAGPAAISPSVERDMLLAKQFRKIRDITLVTKNINGVNKIFGIRSGKYAPMSQNILFDIIDGINRDGVMGKAVCKKWLMSHYKTSVYVEFPDKAEEIRNMEFEVKTGVYMKTSSKLYNDMVPGLLLSTSDTGDSAVTAHGTWRIGNSIHIFSTVSEKHSAKMTAGGFINRAEEEIFANYTKLPEMLCKLMLKDVTSPDWDINTPVGQKLNSDAIEELLKNLFKSIGVVKAIGKKREKPLMELALGELSPTIRYTAYDIAVYLMGFPERVNGLADNSLEMFRKSVGKVPYCDFNVAAADIILVA